MIERRRRFIRQIAREEAEEYAAEKAEHLDEKCQRQIVPHRYLYGTDRNQPEFQPVIKAQPQRQCPRAETEDTLLLRRPFPMETAQKNCTEKNRADDIDGNCHALEDLAVDRRLRADTHRRHKEREEKAPFEHACKGTPYALIGQWQNDCKQNTERHGELNALLQCRHQLLKKCL